MVTDAVEYLVEFDFVLELSIALALLFLSDGMGTSLTAYLRRVSRC